MSSMLKKCSSFSRTQIPSFKHSHLKPQISLSITKSSFSSTNSDPNMDSNRSTTINTKRFQKIISKKDDPECENLRHIETVLREFKNNKIPIDEFIKLVCTYTCDNGAALRSVLAGDIATFQRITRKVYETMTQDVGSILMNEQLATIKFYQERHDFMMQKMMLAINEIYTIAPHFNFKKYFKKREHYLHELLPLPEEILKLKKSEKENKRLQLYHRLQWLRNEGERMAEQNFRLQEKLKQLRKEQQMEQIAAKETQAVLAAQKIELEKEEIKIREQLQQLNENVEKSIIENDDETIRNVTKISLYSDSDCFITSDKGDNMDQKTKPISNSKFPTNSRLPGPCSLIKHPKTNTNTTSKPTQQTRAAITAMYSKP